MEKLFKCRLLFFSIDLCGKIGCVVMSRGRKPKQDKPVCPRCGRPIDWLERVKRGNQVYVYAVHYLGYEKIGNKIRKKVEKCYLGPERYLYVTKTHLRDGLILRGMQDRDRILEYLEALIRALGSPDLSLNSEFLYRLAEKLRVLADRLEELGREVEKAERGFMKDIDT